jgi:hypothetical protein
MTSRLSSVVKQRPIIAFFALAFAPSWIFESPLVLLRDSVILRICRASTESRRRGRREPQSPESLHLGSLSQPPRELRS